MLLLNMAIYKRHEKHTGALWRFSFFKAFLALRKTALFSVQLETAFLLPANWQHWRQASLLSLLLSSLLY